METLKDNKGEKKVKLSRMDGFLRLSAHVSGAPAWRAGRLVVGDGNGWLEEFLEPPRGCKHIIVSQKGKKRPSPKIPPSGLRINEPSVLTKLISKAPAEPRRWFCCWYFSLKTYRWMSARRILWADTRFSQVGDADWWVTGMWLNG
jgi:hypothetical protein